MIAQPTGNRLLVEPIEQKEVTTKSGIIIGPAWNAAPESIQAKVLAIGPKATATKVGDTVIAPQFAPTRVSINPGDKTYIIPEEDVIAYVR